MKTKRNNEWQPFSHHLLSTSLLRTISLSYHPTFQTWARKKIHQRTLFFWFDKITYLVAFPNSFYFFLSTCFRVQSWSRPWSFNRVGRVDELCVLLCHAMSFIDMLFILNSFIILVDTEEQIEDGLSHPVSPHIPKISTNTKNVKKRCPPLFFLFALLTLRNKQALHGAEFRISGSDIYTTDLDLYLCDAG